MEGHYRLKMTARIGPRILKNRHTGEVLELRRVKRGDQVWLELNGTAPPHGEGPPLHVHYFEDEHITVHSGTLSAMLDGRKIVIEAGSGAVLPAGSVHRWWNEGDVPLVLRGFAKPVVDLDRYLQATFEVVNAGTSERPPLFHMAHLLWRHRKTQRLRMGPAWIQSVVFPVIVAIGTMLGKYRGTDWPGCPARCSDAPFSPES